MERKVKVGRKGVEVLLFVKEKNRSEYGKEYPVFIPHVKMGTVEKLLERNSLTKEGLRFYVWSEERPELEKFLGTKIPGNVDGITFYLTSEARKEIEKFLNEVERKNEEQRRKVFDYPSKLRVQEWYIFDMPYKVFVWNKPEEYVEEEKRKLYEETAKLLKTAGEGYVKDYGLYIEAPRELEEGQEIDIEEVLEHYREAIEKGKRIVEEKERKEKEREEKLERKRKEALEEARRTGKEVIVREVYVFDGDSPSREDWMLMGDLIREVYRKYGKGELGMVNVYEVATPEGKIETRAYPSF